MKFIKNARSRDAERWLKQEIAAQKKRYKAIVAEQDALAPKRDRWVAEFLQRIQVRGWHFHLDQMRKIRPEEIPSKPKRKFKVVF